MGSQYVQYGCGFSAPPGWRNFDASPTLRFERLPFIGQLITKNKARFPANVEYGDIVKGLPVPADSCDGVYCSHVLEHLSLADCRAALRNTHRILRPGGLFRFVLPDLERSTRAYLNNPNWDASIQFLKHTHLGHEQRAAGLKDFVFSWLGNAHHLWMWDYKAIEKELEDAGFVDVRRADFGDSQDPKFQEVEAKHRWDNCLGAECRKPS